MTVYVDKLRNYGAAGTWCHMWSDDLDELHSMAEAIGLQSRWFQHKKAEFLHYDLRMSKRMLAIEHGAVEATDIELVTMVRAKRRQLNEESQDRWRDSLIPRK